MARGKKLIKIEICCDFCDRIWVQRGKASFKELPKCYERMKDNAIKMFWVYQSGKDLWYCPRCAEYRNAYEGKLKGGNRENQKEDWHYVEDKDFPPFTTEGVGVTVLNQNNREVFYTRNCGWLYRDPSEVGQTYADVYKWKYK